MARAAWWTGLALAAALPASAAFAQDGDLRFCPNRPSIGSSACITDPGHVQVEYAALDWQRDSSNGEREDQLVVADLLARIGVGARTEVQVEWVTFGVNRLLDQNTGEIGETTGIGDVRLAVRQNLRNPDGEGLSFGIEPFVILPLGGEAIGSGDWEAGAVIPVTYDLTDSFNLGFTGQLAALADEDGEGRHPSYSGIVTLDYALSDRISLSSEVSLERDDDPAGGETHVLAAQSIAWQPSNRTQLDLLAAAGLNHTTPDIRLALGGAVLF